MIQDYRKMSQLRPPKIKTTSVFRPVFASPKWYFPYDILFDIKTTSLISQLLGSQKGGLQGSLKADLDIGILLYLKSVKSSQYKDTDLRNKTNRT